MRKLLVHSLFSLMFVMFAPQVHSMDDGMNEAYDAVYDEEMDDGEDCPECELVDACFEDSGKSAEECCGLNTDPEEKEMCLVFSNVDACFERNGTAEECCAVIQDEEEKQMCLEEDAEDISEE